MPRCFENGNGDFGPEAFRAIHCAQMVKRFHGSRRFIFTGSWSASLYDVHKYIRLNYDTVVDMYTRRHAWRMVFSNPFQD